MTSNFKKTITLSICVGLSGSLLTSCAPSLGGSDYAVSGVGEVSQTLSGVIISARPVLLRSGNRSGDDGQMNMGGLAGAGLGAALGSQIGGGNARYVTGALGAVAGGVAGQNVEKNLKTQRGVEYQVRLNNGSIVTLAQGEEPRMGIGQKVFVVKSARDRSRIVPAY